MAGAPHNPGFGIAATLVWAVFVGLPLLVFHTGSNGLTAVDHVHAAVLFLASIGLIFWFGSRIRPIRRLSSRANRPAKSVNTSADGSPLREVGRSDELFVTAELVAAASDDQSRHADHDSAMHQVKFVVSNYFGSSRSRRVYLEPGGQSYVILPNQSLIVVARAASSVPTIRVIESDHATQIAVEGIGADVAVVSAEPNVPEPAHL